MESKLTSLRREIALGRYEVDTQKVAGAILRRCAPRRRPARSRARFT
jgi:anti-sigma28 factor (negative regulator of flagellin synthesis)